eukprot:m.461417 g.461417  ORF g.461417 m.461417 type:complete len:52 (+) comp22298_c0_seq1:709-864(+)
MLNEFQQVYNIYEASTSCRRLLASLQRQNATFTHPRHVEIADEIDAVGYFA